MLKKRRKVGSRRRVGDWRDWRMFESISMENVRDMTMETTGLRGSIDVD